MEERKMKNLNINVVFASITALIIGVLVLPKNDSGKISVVGKCYKKVKKDKFALSITIKNVEQDSGSAIKKSLSTYGEVSSLLKSIQEQNKGLEIETTEYTTRDKYEWNSTKNSNEKVGVEGIIGVRVITSNPEILSSITFDLAQYKDVYTSNFENFVSQDVYNVERENCIAEAIKNAHAQAEKIATSNGQSVGEMIYADYNGENNYVGARYYMAKATLMDDMDEGASIAPASIFSGNENISVSVDVSFKLK